MGRGQLYTRPRPAFCCEIRRFQAYKRGEWAALFEEGTAVANFDIFLSHNSRDKPAVERI